MPYQLLQNGPDMRDMLLAYSGVHLEVVYVYHYTATQHISKRLVNEGLKHRGCICQAVGHYPVFLVPSAGNEGGLPFFPLPDVHQVVGTA
jgi:hypothetical protein